MSSNSEPTPIDRTARVRHYPRLTRFYGLTFEELAAMPHWAMALYVEAMPEIEAGEQLSALQASDFPHIEQSARTKIHRQLLRIADVGEAAEKVDVTSQADAKTLSGMGIRVVTTSVKPEEVTEPSQI